MTTKTSDVWDEKVQTYHAGQGWKFLSNYVADFSVTCNCLGTPSEALQTARDAVALIEHYPAADFEPGLSSLAKWIYPRGDIKSRFTLGNGASELIDLVTREAPPGPFKPGPSIINNTPVQYMEYQRSAEADGRAILHSNSSIPESLSAIINPCNPTGLFLTLPELKHHIETKLSKNSHVLVDESMLPWYGPDWRDQSLVSVPDWIKNIYKQKGIAVWIIHSWTKIWCCPGVRLGSVVAPTEAHMIALKKKQVPWSLNTMALSFVHEVVKDDEYMITTWQITKQWRAHSVNRIASVLPAWKCYGEPWLSWIWIDTGDEKVAARADELSKQFGVPIRPGSKGYKMPRFIRIGVRSPEELEILINAWKSLTHSPKL